MPPPRNVCEIGTGNGQNLKHIGMICLGTMIGVEGSRALAKQTRDKLEKSGRNCFIMTGDVTSMRLPPGSIDLGWS